MSKIETQLVALREFKRAMLEAAQRASIEANLDISFDGTSEWVEWGQMTKSERAEHPGAQDAGGFYRIGVAVHGHLTL